MEIPINKTRQFVSLEYPGVVQNVSKMLQTVGGETALSRVYSDTSRRLELRYRPNDILCKPMCGDRHSCNNLLIRVRRRKKKLTPVPREDTMAAVNEYEYKVEMIGMISTLYKFSSKSILCIYFVFY